VCSAAGAAAGYHPLDFAHQSSNRLAASTEAAQHVLALSDQQIGALPAASLRRSAMTDEKRKYRSEALAAVHETMQALHEVGALGKLSRRAASWA
jgi:hypothetical protein